MTPHRLFLSIVASIMVVEVIVMYLLPLIVPPGTSEWLENFADGALLSILVSPVLYLLVVKPLQSESYMAQLRADLIVKNSVTGFVLSDGLGNISHMTRQAHSLLPIRSLNGVGAHLKDLFPSEVVETLRSSGEADIRFITDMGTEKIILVKRNSVADGAGIDLVFTLEDVTVQRAIAREQEGQRTKMVHSSRLASLGEMAGGVAHEINTPLAAIKLMNGQIARLAELESPNLEDIKKYTQRLDKTVDSIAYIVSSLRNFSGLGGSSERQKQDLFGILKNTASLCQEKFRNHNIELKLPTQSAEIMVDCVPAEISQVLLSFLNNAYDAATIQTEKWVRVDLKSVGGHAVLSVTDSGPGIDHEIERKIFDPFFTTKEFGTATGLGLSVALGIVKAHGGNININRNIPNTQFEIELPLSIAS
jgi:signal transduction histidine kinase